MSFFAELKRRNVLRAGAFYAGAVWALAQGISQLGPSFGAPDWFTRWFVIAGVIGFPFAMLFSWFYEWTPHGIVRESDVAQNDSITHSTGRKLDFAIIGVLSLAVVLLLTNQFVAHKDTDAVAAAPDKSIAVLPLANASGDKNEQFFSDGLSENLITALSQFSGLKVIGRNSAFQFRDSKDDSKTIGAKLGVANLLEGSVQHAGDVVRINAELIKAADGSTVWSQRYDRPYKDLFKLQDDITQSVATALKTKLLASAAAAQTDRPPSGNLDAYNAYLQGKFYYERNTEADDRKAIDAYTAATRLDPRYALAWAALSRTWSSLVAQYLGPARAQQAYAQARAAVTTALTLESNLAVAHTTSGYLLSNADFDWTGAEAEYRRAVQLAPNDGNAMAGLGNLLATLGQTEQAVALTRQALATDPLNARWHLWLARLLSGLGRLDEAEQAVRKAIELQPAAASYHEKQAVIAIQRGDAKAALAAAQAEPDSAWQDIALALAQQIGDNRAVADAALKNLVDKDASGSSFQIAEVYALRKDADNTFVWLDRAWMARDAGITNLLYDPFILRYQHDPRFAAFCKKVGLPTTTEAKAMP